MRSPSFYFLKINDPTPIRSRKFKLLLVKLTVYVQLDRTITECTNTKSLAKEFSKILTFEYFGYLKLGFNVFFDADSESPLMT